MSKKLLSKLFVLLLVVGLLFAVAPTGQAEAAVTVTTEAELRDALAGSETTIELGASFTLAATVDVNRSVSIDGKGFVITGPPVAPQPKGHGFTIYADGVTIRNLTITGSGRSNLNFYVATGGVVENVVLSNAGDAGMIVNGSQVTISGVTTTNNAWGGINVDQGGGVTAIPLLTVTNATNHTSPTSGITPAIWVDTGNADWVSVADGLYAVVSGPPLSFFDIAEYSALFPVHNETQDTYYTTIQAAIDAAVDGNLIEVAPGTYAEAITLNKPNITVRSTAGAATTFIDAPLGTLTTGVQVPANMGTVTFDGFTVQNFTESGIIQGMAARTGTTFHVLNNIVRPHAEYLRNGIQVSGDGSTVIGNTVYGERLTDKWASAGITVANASNVTVKNNTVIGGLTGVDNGIALVPWYNDMSNITIEGNTISEAYDGVNLGANPDKLFSISGVTIKSNIIVDSTEGIGAYHLENLTDLVIEKNQFTDLNAGGLWIDDVKLSGEVNNVDASPNWWGSASGPDQLSNDVYIKGETVDATVYTPWCTVPDCSELSKAKLSMDYSSTGTTDTCSTTQTQTVDVYVQDVAYLTAYGLEVGFNPALVEVTAVANADWLDPDQGFESPGKLIDNVNGKVVFGWAAQGSGDGASEPVSGAGALIKITFKAKGLAGDPQFTVNADNSSLIGWEPGNEGMPIPFEVSAGESFNFGSVVTNTTKSPTVSYCDLATAVSAATSGDTLRADVDFETTASVNLNKTIIFNTNGHTITRNNAASEYDSLFRVNNSNVNLTVTGGGTLNATNGTAATLGAAIQISGPLFKTASVTLEEGTTLSGGYSSIYVYRGTFTMSGGTVTDGIAMMSGGTANISGGLVQGSGAAISGNSTQSDSNITISGTAVIDGGDGWAIYHPQRGNLNITGGTITGATGIEMRAGSLTISGSPEITATAGDAILINGNVSSDYQGLLSVTISGGEFNSTGGYALRETAPATTRTSNIAVTGGSFTGSLGSVNFTTVDPAILKLTAGAYNTDPGASPDYVFDPLDTYLNTDNYYYIDTIISGTIAAYDLPAVAETVTGDVVDFLGDIPWYPADPAVGRTQGNRVGVYITEPTGFDPSQATLTIGTQTWNWQDAKDNPADNFVPVWKLITTVPQTTLMTVQWNPVSTQVFTVNVQTGSVLLAPPEPIITSTDIQGYYLAGEAREFNVKLEMPADGANYALMIFDYKLAGVTTADITKFEFFAQDLGQWIVLGSRAQETYGNCTDNSGICGQFGWAPGGFGPIAAGFTNTTQFRVTFAKGFVAPLSFTLDLSGKLAATDTAWTSLTTYTGLLDVYDKATVTIGNVDPYFLVDEPGAFNVTVSNPTTGCYYNNTVVFDVEITPPTGGGISALVCTSVAPMPVHTWTFDSTDFTVDSVTGKITARLGGEDDYFIVPNLGIDGVVNCTATFTKEGTYSTSGNMVDVVSTAPVVERIVSNAVSASVDVYRAPEISAVFPAGPYLAGVPVTIPITITNPDGLTDPFKLQVVLSDGTTLTFVVDPAGYPTTQNIVITFEPDQSGDVVLNLYDDTTLMNGRLLDTATQTGVVVNSGFIVTGDFSMQGNLSRAGVPVTFTWGGDLVSYGPTGYSTAVSGTNFSQVLTYGGSYTITTNQPRYLNVYSDVSFQKMITLTGDDALPALRLRGGNAVWTGHATSNNIIDLADANKVGIDWGPSGSSDLTINHGDVNFDGKVNIQDLALVGGNFELTSATAYGTWTP